MTTDPSPRSAWVRAAILAGMAFAVAIPAGVWAFRNLPANAAPPVATAKDPPNAGATTIGGVPLFATWPKDQKPEVVLVLTGQTDGYLSPCGCSRPQKGGLERRANFIAGLRAKGWPVVPLDLGDLAPVRKVSEQDRLKYKYTMESYREMGYAAVGLGVREFDQQLWELLAGYALANPDAPPTILAANLVGLNDKQEAIPRPQQFPGAGKKLLVEAVEVIGKDSTGKDHLPVGVTALVGESEYAGIKKADPQFGFLRNEDVLPQALQSIKAKTKGTGVNVLLYNGAADKAEKMAAAYPDFHVWVCRSVDSEPPQFPTLVNDGRTFVVQVGHRGQNVGVVGVFKTDAGYELKYQLVPMTEEFLTPDDPKAEAENKVLQKLEQYRADVKRQDLLAKFVARPLPHPAQIQNPDANLSYVGSQACFGCHPNEAKAWTASKHSHAMEALEKYAKRPGLAQFDGECVQCHSVGFGLQTGYRNKEATPLLQHVGCESCHGPGSGHAAAPNNAKLLAALSPWKTQPTDKLPAKDVLEKLATVKIGDPSPVRLEAKQQQVLTAVSAMCMKCHDQDNDPKFDANKYLPLIWHSGFRAVK